MLLAQLSSVVQAVGPFLWYRVNLAYKSAISIIISRADGKELRAEDGTGTIPSTGDPLRSSHLTKLESKQEGQSC
jgi:hypothetical protein